MFDYHNGINFDQDIELRAVQNEDFEQQYLGHCLRETKKESVITIPQISRTLSQKSIEAECLHKTPPETDTPYDENYLLTQAQTQEIFGRKYFEKHERRGSSSGAKTNLLSSFYMRRFIDKISVNRKRLLNMNEIHYNLIEDKASDSQTLFTHQNQFKNQGYSLTRMKTFLRKETGIKDVTTSQILKQQLKKLQKSCLQMINSIINKIPIAQPESLFKMLWDFFASVFRIMLVLLIPLEIAFEPDILFDNYIFLTAIILTILQLDFLIRINTQCYKNGAAITDHWELLAYQFKKEFFTNLSTSLVLIIFLIIPKVHNYANLLLLVSLAQFQYIYETFAKSDQVSYLTRPLRGVIGLIKFILTLLFILHLFSCIWFWFSKLHIEDSWIIFSGLDVKTWQLQYLEALYFAVVTMLTIGYGDNVPKNSIEKIVTMVFILGACIQLMFMQVSGMLIVQILLGAQLMILHKIKLRGTEELGLLIDTWIKEKYHLIQNISSIANYFRIKEYLTFRWKEDDEVDLEVEQALLDQLSDELKEELDKEAHKIFIQKSALLQKYFSTDFRDAISKSIKRKIIPPQNIFSTEIDGTQHLCFIEQGVLIYQHPDKKQRSKMNATIKQGQFFCVNEFILQSPKIDLFKANGYVSLLILSKKDFMKTIKHYPEDYQKFCELKELITLSYKPPALENGVFCPACFNFQHSLSYCPQVTYVPDREGLIKKYCMPKIQLRKFFNRMTTKRFCSDQLISKTKLEKDIVQQFAQIFQTENPQLIQQQLKIQVIEEQDSNSSCGEVSPRCFKISNDRFQTAIQKSKRIIPDSPQQGSNTPRLVDARSNLHQVLQRRKQSIFSLNLSGGLGTSPKTTLLNIPKTDTIKEKEESEESSDSSDSNSNSDSSREKVKKCGLTVVEFNENMIENITNLYHQLQRELESNENDDIVKKALNQIEPLYWSCNNQKLYDFEMMSNFEFYFNEQNYFQVIKAIERNGSGWQVQYLQKLQQFMLYPFSFIQKYMEQRRNIKHESQAKSISKRLSNRLHTLKNSLKLKKKSVVIKPMVKFGQIAPDL